MNILEVWIFIPKGRGVPKDALVKAGHEAITGNNKPERTHTVY